MRSVLFSARLRAQSQWSLRFGLAAIRHLGAIARPLLDLAIRLLIAQAFWVSGLLKAADWQHAVELATHEYPVSWLDPVSAAALGLAVELICPPLLALGLFTRLAALPMALLALVIQFNYVALDAHLLWAVLLGRLAWQGADRLALDQALRAGLADSALPLAGLLRMGELLTASARRLAPLLLRIWLALALVAGESFLLPQLVLAHTALALPLALLLLTGALHGPVVFGLLLAQIAGPMLGMADAGSALLLMLLLFLLAEGAGPLSLDASVTQYLMRRLDNGMTDLGQELPHIVIVGAGFGGMACAMALRFLPVRITLIDRRNHHLFQPLLYQVATASLSPAEIAVPVRAQFREDPRVQVVLGSVTGIDTAGKQVQLGERRIGYDTLVLATGASHSYFGRDEWAAFAPGLKRLEDATAIRHRVLAAFEQAEVCQDPLEQQRLQTFVIVGGGPTGVELAGAIAELARHGLRQEFRRIDPARSTIVLVQSGDRLLPAFTPALSARAKADLEQLGVEVRLGGRVNAIDDQGVQVGNERLPAATVLWAAGVVASPAARWLGCAADNAGRVKVAADLSVPGLPEVFVIGDTAASSAWDGQPVPGLAPAAKQGGEYVANVIRARLAGRSAPQPFRYRHLGSMATIGRKSAVVDFGWLKLSGAPAWWLWGAVHVLFLAGLRNRMAVVLDWVWAYFTFRLGARLITGTLPPVSGDEV